MSSRSRFLLEPTVISLELGTILRLTATIYHHLYQECHRTYSRPFVISVMRVVCIVLWSTENQKTRIFTETGIRNMCEGIEFNSARCQRISTIPNSFIDFASVLLTSVQPGSQNWFQTTVEYGKFRLKILENKGKLNIFEMYRILNLPKQYLPYSW